VGKIREKNTTNPLVFLWSGTKTKNYKRKKEITIHTKKAEISGGGESRFFFVAWFIEAFTSAA